MKFLRKLRTLFRKEKLDAEMSAEMAAHVELQVQRNLAAGMNPDEARYLALRQFGNVAKIQEECREQRSWVWLEHWVRDFRFALRSLRRSRGFALSVFLTLLLCIGPNTAVMSALYTMVIKPLPFRDPSQLVVIKGIATKASNLVGGAGVPQYLDYAAHADRFERFALIEAANTTFGEDSVPTRAMGQRVTANFFDLLGIAPLAGRFFTHDEETIGRDYVLVLAHSFWVKQFQADPGVIGRSVRMGGEMYTIIGVAPPALEALFIRTDFLKPFQYGPENLIPDRRYASRGMLVGRLKPGVTPTDGLTQLTTIETRFRDEEASPGMRDGLTKAGFRLTVEPWRNDTLVPVQRPLWMLQAGALLVLLIGCVNVANLMLARVNVKRAELAIRVALGAGWGALFRQMFCEIMVLVGLAAAAGVVFGWGAVRLLNHSLVITARFAPPLELDSGIVAVVLSLCVAAALFVGLLPLGMLRRSGLRVGETRVASASGGMRVLSGSLVVAQVALALVLLVGAGLLIRSFANVMAVDPGFDATHVIQGRVALGHTYDEAKANAAVRHRVIEAMRTIPGVTNIAVSSYFGVGPASTYRAIPYTVRRTPVPPDGNHPLAYINPVSAGYFSTMGARLLEGQEFIDDDDPNLGYGYIVDRTFAERNFPGRSALGEEISFGGGPFPDNYRWPRIVGVVDRINVAGLEERDGLPFIYTPMGQGTTPGFNVLVSTKRPAADVLADMRTKLRGVDPALPLYNTGTLQETLDLMLLPRRVVMTLLAIFAALALVLAAVGLYGMLAYDVAQRTREIGIRGAIGASRNQIIGLILGQGLRKTGLGLFLGLGIAFFLTRYLRSLLFDIQRVDPVSFLGVTVLLLIVALLASWLPARRAAKVDPVIALRAE